MRASQINLGEWKIKQADRFYLTHIAHVKQDAVLR